MADESATTLGKSIQPSRYAGGMTAFLNRKATDSTMTRLTPACGIALVKAMANRCNRFASAFEMGARGPNADKTASWPLMACSSSTLLSRSPCLIVMRSLNELSRSGERTNAVTECPRSIACRTISCPVPPVAPSTSSFIVFSSQTGRRAAVSSRGQPRKQRFFEFLPYGVSVSRCRFLFQRCCRRAPLLRARELLHHVEARRDEEAGDNRVRKHAGDHNGAQYLSRRRPGTRSEA